MFRSLPTPMRALHSDNVFATISSTTIKKMPNNQTRENRGKRPEAIQISGLWEDYPVGDVM